MLHLAIICMVCAVLAPIEGTALIGVNNNKSNIFCRADERERREKSFTGQYDVDGKNCFDCSQQKLTDRTHCIFHNSVTKQCQFSRTLCSLRKKFPDRKKRNPDPRLEYSYRKRNIYGLLRSKGRMGNEKVASSNKNKPFVKLTCYERNKLKHLKRVGKGRRKRRTRESHLDKVELDDDLDINKRIEKLVKRIALENTRSQENTPVSPVTEPDRVIDVSTRYSEDSTKGLAFPFFNNIKQIFRFSKGYFDSRRVSQDKRGVTDPIQTPHTMSKRESEDTKTTRLRRNVPTHFISMKLRKDGNRLGGWTRTLNTPNRVAFSAVKRKRRRRKRDHRHQRSRLDSSSKESWPPFNQMYSNHKTDYNQSKLKEDNKTNSKGSQKRSVVTTGLPPFYSSPSSSIDYRNIFNITDSESLTHGQGTGSVRGSNMLDDHNRRNVLYHDLEEPVRRGDAKPYNDQSGHRMLGYSDDRKLLRSGKYLKIRHALRNYIQHNNDWALKRKILMERRKRCEGKGNNVPHKCWRSAPLLCIPFIRKGQDELLKYIIKTLQNMLGKPMPRKVDIFDKIKFKPYVTTPETECEDIMPGYESESTTETCVTTSTTTTTNFKPYTSSPSPSSTILHTLLLVPNFLTTESTCPTMSCTTTNYPSFEQVTGCGESVSCSLQVTTWPPSTIPPPLPTTDTPLFPPTTATTPLSSPSPTTTTTTTTPPPTTTTTTPLTTTTTTTPLPPTTTTTAPPLITTTTTAPPLITTTTTTTTTITTTYPTPVTCPPPVTSLQPVTYPSVTPCPPSSTTTYAPASQNTYGLLVIGTASSILSDIGPFPTDSTPTPSGKDYSNDGCSTEAPVLQGTEPSAPMTQQQQQQTQIPINYFQITVEDDKSGVVTPSGCSANTATPNYPPTCTMQAYTFPTSPPNKVTVRDLDQGCSTASPHVLSTQEIQAPVTQNSPQWYFSEIPIEKSEILTFTTLDCTHTPDPDTCYKYYQPYTQYPSNEQPQTSTQRQTERQQQIPCMYIYKTDVTSTQRSSLIMGSGNAMPLEFDLSYHNKLKPRRDFCDSDTVTDFLPETSPKQDKSLKETNFEEPNEKFRVREEQNLFPGDPFAYRHMDTTDGYLTRMSRPRVMKLLHKKIPKFIRRANRKLTPKYDFYDYEPRSSNHQIDNERYGGYDPTETSGRELNERVRKAPKKNQKRDKREIFYRDSYPSSKNYDNYHNYFDDSNVSDQYPENLLLLKLNLEKGHLAKKREDQNSSAPETYALFSELADMATLSPNETEKLSERPVNITPPQVGLTSCYDNSLNQTASMISADHVTIQNQTISGDTTTELSVTTTVESKGSTQALKSSEFQKAQIVDSGKPDNEAANNYDIEAKEKQIMTTIKTGSIVKGPKKSFTKPAPKVYTKVFPDSLPNELETNETPTASTTPKTDKTTVVQTLAAPDVRLQLLAVCEGYLEIVKLIKAQNQSLEEELDSDLCKYCENIISQSFNLQADNAIRIKKPESSSSTTTTTPQTAPKKPNKLVSKRTTCDRYRCNKDRLNQQHLRAKVVVDILGSPVYKKELATHADQNNFYPKGGKTKRMRRQPQKMNDKGMSSRKYKYKERARKDFSNSKTGLRNQRKRLQRREGTKTKFSRKRISQEEMDLLHLLRKRRRALLSWLSNSKETQIEPNDLEETEYHDDDEYNTMTAQRTEDSGTITPKGDQETSEWTTKTTLYANDTIFPVYAKRYGYDRGGELKEVEVLWRRVNKETHEEKIFKNMSVLALLLTSTMAPYMKRKESKFAGGNVYEAEEMSEIQSNSDSRAGFVDSSTSLKKNPVNTSFPPPIFLTTIYLVSFKPEFEQTNIAITTAMSTTVSSTTTTPLRTTPPTEPTTLPKTTSTTQHQIESETVRSSATSKKNQTYILMRKPDPSTIVGSTPNSTKGHKNSTRKMPRKIDLAKEFFQEYSIEFLNYAVYILPIMFTILFIMCCLCCFLQILHSREGFRRSKKKKRLMSTEEDFDTTGDSDGETKIRKKKKKKKSLKSDADSENLENRRLRAFWNVLKMNSRGKQREGISDDTSTPTEKRRSFLQFLKVKKGAAKPEELASLSYPPPCERDEGSDEEAGIRRQAKNVNDELNSEIKGPIRENKEADERREIISLLEELKKIELENLEEKKNKKSVQYVARDEENTVFANGPDISCSYQVGNYFTSHPFSDKRFLNPPAEDLPVDAGELMELVPYKGDHAGRKNHSLRHFHFRTDRGSRCERFFKMFRRSGDGMNFTKTGHDNKTYIYTKYKNISTETRDELMGGTRGNGNADKNSSDDFLNDFPPYSVQRDKRTDIIVDEMEILKRQLNKKKNVPLKDNGVLCRL